MKTETELEMLINELGGPSRVAQRLDIWPSAVTNWLARGSIPGDQAIRLESILGRDGLARRLRPDLSIH